MAPPSHNKIRTCMTSEILEDARARLESAKEKHARFVRESERFLYEYVQGMIRGFDRQGHFNMQLRKPKDSVMKGHPRMLAVEIIEAVRSNLDYIVFALSLRNNPDMNKKHPKFVIVDDRTAFDVQSRTALKHLTASERKFMEDLQPFSTNGNLLPLIRDAANRVKHRKLLTIRTIHR